MRYFRTAMLTVAAAGALALGLGATSASAATTNLKIAPGTAIDVTFPESVSCPGGVTGYGVGTGSGVRNRPITGNSNHDSARATARAAGSMCSGAS